ncbi:hypothetical protein ON010_g3664 [Phytophthora cinnamomi]|nr:hypothetical protein ON010_g3664 [Phytophthora cinnamomi]
MDSSNQGLAVLDATRRRYIQLKFNVEEITLIAHATGANTFNINVREQLCVTLACWIWGPKWKPKPGSLTHVRAWTDNTSAAAWTNNLDSSNSLSGAKSRNWLRRSHTWISNSAGQVPGACNTLADAGSRAWTAPHNTIWPNFTSSWTQDQIPSQLRHIYRTFSMTCKPNHSPPTVRGNTLRRGTSGLAGAANMDTLPGYTTQTTTNRISWSCSLYPCGYHTMANEETLPAPFCPNSAKLRGIIGGTEARLSDCMPDTNW